MARRKRLWLWICALTPLTLCGAGYVVFDRALSTSSLAEEKAALKLHGIPLTVAELRAQDNSLPERDNVARDYERVFATLHASTARWSELESVYGNLTPIDRMEKAIIVAQLQPELRELYTISLGAGINFHRQWEKGIDVEYRELEGFRLATRLLRDSAKQKSAAGDEEGALVDIACLFRMSRHMQRQAGLVPFFSAATMERFAMDCLRQTLSHSRRRSTFQKARKLVASLPLPDVHRMIADEPVMAEAKIRFLANPPPRAPTVMCGTDGYPDDTLIYASKLASVREAFHARLLKPFRIASEVVPTNPRQMSDIYLPLEKVLADPSLDDLAGRLLLIAEGNLIGIPETFRSIESSRKLIDLATSIALNRNPPKPETDPRTGTPFVVKQTSQGTLVYGFGRDKKDNGGVPVRVVAGGGSDEVVMISNSLQ